MLFPSLLNTSAIDYPGWQWADAIYLGVKQVDKLHKLLRSKNLGTVMNNMLYTASAFMDANFSPKGPIPGYWRRFAESSNDFAQSSKERFGFFVTSEPPESDVVGVGPEVSDSDGL